MHLPREPHWKAVKRILRYLQGTWEFGLFLHHSESLNITGFSDSDWATDVDDRRSTSGMCVYLGRNLVTWSSKKQPTVSRSSTEAEYRRLASATAEILWLKLLLRELRVTSRSPIIWVDNLSTILLSANPIQNSRTKHMELDLYFVREKVVSKEIEVNHVPSAEQLADVFTKATSSPHFGKMRSRLTVDSFQVQNISA